MTGYRFTILLSVVVLACFVVGCAHYGQRLLEARIECDGQVVLRTHFGVPDNWDQRTAWRQLESHAFEVADTAVLDGDTVSPATLTGRIRITLNHAGNAWAAVEVNSIALSKNDAGSNSWKLAPGEVDRTAKSVGGYR